MIAVWSSLWDGQKLLVKRALSGAEYITKHTKPKDHGELMSQKMSKSKVTLNKRQFRPITKIKNSQNQINQVSKLMLLEYVLILMIHIHYNLFQTIQTTWYSTMENNLIPQKCPQFSTVRTISVKSYFA